MGKYLKLRFEDAGVFPFYEKGSRLVDGTDKKTGEKRQENSGSVGINQVSNMLHVLANKRPIKSFPRTYGGKIPPDQSHLYLKRVESIFDMAENSHIKIDNIFKDHNPNNKNNLETANPYYAEFMQLSKNVYNSYAHKEVSINENWTLLKNYMDNDELFNELVQNLSKLLGKNVLEYRKNNIFNEVVELFPTVKSLKCKSGGDVKKMLMTVDHPLNDLIDKLIRNKKTPVALQLTWSEAKSGRLTVKEKDLKTTVLNRNGISKDSTRLSGKLIVYIDDWYEEQIRNGKGYATLLDDGVVFIEDIIDGDYFLNSELDGFVKLNKLKEHEDSSKIIKK